MCCPYLLAVSYYHSNKNKRIKNTLHVSQTFSLIFWILDMHLKCDLNKKKWLNKSNVVLLCHLAMPLPNPATSNKRKKASKIITDLSHISQNGKVWVSHIKQTAMPLNPQLKCVPVKLSFTCCDFITRSTKEQIFCICLPSALSACCRQNCVSVNHCMWLYETMIKYTHPQKHAPVPSGNRIPNMHVESPGGLWVVIGWRRGHKSVTIAGDTK